MRPVLGVFPKLSSEITNVLSDKFEIYPLHNIADPTKIPSEDLSRIQYLITASYLRVETKFFELLPNLKMISNWGVGLDHIDIKYLEKNKIPVTNTPDVLNECVADMAIGLLLAISRKICFSDRFVRGGKWNKFPSGIMGTRVSGKKIGIYGLGRIGKKIADRAKGFNMEIGYHGRHEQKGQSYRYFKRLSDLALWCDYFVISAPATPETEGSIDREIIQNIGPHGYLINIARGAVVDENELIKALKEQKIAGASLDVFLNEPNINRDFFKLDNVVIQPHNASFTYETINDMIDLVIANLNAQIDGKPLLTPVY